MVYFKHVGRWAKRNPLLAIALVVAVLGMALLSLGSQSLQPLPSPINFSSIKEGTYISIVGVVTSISPRDHSHSVTVCESKTSDNCARVLMSKSVLPPTLMTDDFITVRGTVRMYLGHSYLVTSQPSDVTIISPPAQ